MKGFGRDGRRLTERKWSARTTMVATVRRIPRRRSTTLASGRREAVTEEARGTGVEGRAHTLGA